MNMRRISGFLFILFLFLLPVATGCDKPERSAESYGIIVNALPTLSNAKPGHEHMQGEHADCVFEDEDFF